MLIKGRGKGLALTWGGPIRGGQLPPSHARAAASSGHLIHGQPTRQPAVVGRKEGENRLGWIWMEEGAELPCYFATEWSTAERCE